MQFTSSSRFDGVPGYRASSAFDGDPARGWIGTWLPGRPAWIAWRLPRPAVLRSLRLVPLAAPVRVPTSVRLTFDAGSTGSLPVAASGEVRLPLAVRSRSVRIDVLASVYPGGAPRAERSRRAVGIADVVGAPVARIPRSGPARFACGDARLRVGGRLVRLQPRGTVSQLDAGTPLRASGCGGRARAGGALAPGSAPPATRLASGTQSLDALPGPVRIDHLMLASTPRTRPAQQIVDAGRVTDPGTVGRTRVDGVRLSNAPGHWLVLGESYNRGWRAYCGGHSLGEPVPIDGFANGWLVGRDCPKASFRFAPQRAVQWGFVLSGIACLLLLAFLVVGAITRRAPNPEVALAPWLPDAPAPARMPLRRAAAIALPAALVLAFLFALRAGPLIGVALTVILWRGVGARTLALTAGALLAVVVPILYALFPGPDRGGFNPEYAIKHLGAHWVAVAAYVLLAAALARTLSTASRASGGRRAGRAASGA